MTYLNSLYSSSSVNDDLSSYYKSINNTTKSSSSKSTSKTTSSTKDSKVTTDTEQKTSTTSKSNSKTFDDLLAEVNDTASNFSATLSAATLNSSMNLFGSTNKKTNSYYDRISLLVTNYATIKNGVFFNALKNYYNNKKQDASSTEDKEILQSKNLSNFKDTLSNIKGDENSIKLAINSAKSSARVNAINGSSDKSYMDKVVNAVSDFANSFNDMLDNTKDLTSTKVLRNVVLMTDTTNFNSQSLSEIGITVGSNNRLSVDKDKLKNADINQIESVFGHNSYGEYIAQKSSSLNSVCASEIKSAKNLETLDKLSSYSNKYSGSYIDSYY